MHVLTILKTYNLFFVPTYLPTHGIQFGTVKLASKKDFKQSLLVLLKLGLI